MNYTTLQAKVASYLHRADATTDTNIATFIDMARLRLGAEMRALCNFTTGTVTSFVNGLTALPTNLAQLASVTIDGVPCREMPYEQLQQFTTSTSMYAVAGQDLYIPNAGSTTVADLTYYTVPAALSAGSDVSEGMVEFPQLWIYAAVIEGYIWERDFESAAALTSQYEQMLAAINRAGYEARFAGAAVTSDQPMIQSMGWL